MGKKGKGKRSKQSSAAAAATTPAVERPASGSDVEAWADRRNDTTLRGPSLDELVVHVPKVLSKAECKQVEVLHRGQRPMGEDHDRQATLSFAHEVWRVEKQLKETAPDLYERLILKLMTSVDEAYFNLLHVAFERDTQKLRIANECKRGKDKVLIRPEVEYIVYDADEALRSNSTLPHIGPHTDNSSALTLVCLLCDPRTFEGGVSYFCPGRKGDAEPRELRLAQGDCVLFRGESCVHWISDVTRGRRSILQIELALCAGTKDQPISGQQARSRSRNAWKGK